MKAITTTIKEIKAVLKDNASEKDKAFFTKMVPGTQTIYGVKTPVLNDLAKKYKEGSFELAEALWHAGSQEERVIAIKIMEKKGKTDPQRLLRLFKEFSTTIGNWAVCDGLGMQFLRSIVKTHRDEIFAVADKFNRSSNMWQRRLSLVMLEWYTRHSDNHAAIKKLTAALEKDDEYYVKKAVVWIKRNLAGGK
ncbi:MAG: DNA alkylation repair protein [Chitinophagaceae bacterium]|nr:DNA alkylation repair protein [Chitinophagaceae bacterium]